MKVLVTGGAGFIGGNLCRALLAADFVTEVSVLDNLSTGRREHLDGLDLDFVEGTLLDPAALDKAMSGAGAVVHLAARGSVPRSVDDPVASHEANATGTIQLLEAVRRNGLPHVLAASSSSVYGGNLTLPKREDLAPMPLSPYAASKLATEAYIGAYANCYGIDVLPFRFFNVFGPLQHRAHDYAAVVPAFVDAARRGEPLPVHGDGRQTRDFTFVGSVVEVIVDAIRRRVTHPTGVNLAFGSRVSLLELIEALEAVFERPLERHHGEPRAGDARDTQADTTLLRSLFPDVEPVPLTTGLRATVSWFLDQP